MFLAVQQQTNQKPTRFLRVFELSVGIIFALTAVAKVRSLLSGNRDLFGFDPLLGFMPQSWLIAGTAGLELLVVSVILFSNNTALRLTLILWISSVFAIYRIGLIAVGAARHCNCLGTEQFWWLSGHQDVLNNALMAILAYMLAGSAWFLFLRRHRKASEL